MELGSVARFQSGTTLRAIGTSSGAQFVTGGVLVRPSQSVPLWVNLEARQYHNAELRGCATDSFAPFCAWVKLTEWRVGAAYEFRGLWGARP